jgi:hypothetical protein
VFKPVRISGMPDFSATEFPRFQMDGFAWRIYQKAEAAN